MKSFAHKLLAITCILALVTGCASVTDAGLETQPEQDTEADAAAHMKGQEVRIGVDLGMGNPDLATPDHVVEKICEAARNPRNHRYSASRGVKNLRAAATEWYQRRHGVELDPESEAIVTIGSKEGLAHLALATTGPGDAVLVPNPAYPIHPYGFVISGADIRHVPLTPEVDFFAELEKAITDSWPKPKMLVLNFPGNPTAHCVEPEFFERVVAVAREHGIWVVHDIAYAEIVFDGYRAPSILEVPGAREVAVETYSLSKTYNMPGWRVGFVCGNADLIAALARIKSYLDYGMFTPIQVAAIHALESDQGCVEEIRSMYQRRRDVLCEGLEALGWPVTKPRATMFVWARIPDACRDMGSLEFAKKLLAEARVAVSPGIGFGSYGDDYVRISLIENEQRIRQALRGIRSMFRDAHTREGNSWIR